MVISMRLVEARGAARSRQNADGETVKDPVTVLTFFGVEKDGFLTSQLELTVDDAPALKIGGEILVGVTLEPTAAASPIPSPLPRAGDADPSAPAQADPPAPATIEPTPTETPPAQ